MESLFNKFAGFKTCNFIKKEIPTQVFSCELGEIFKNTFFVQNLRATVSVKLKDKTVKERRERRCNQQLDVSISNTFGVTKKLEIANVLHRLEFRNVRFSNI